MPEFTLVRGGNSKLGKGVRVWSTYHSPDTCPCDCPHKDRGCYARFLRGAWRRQTDVGVDWPTYCQHIARIPRKPGTLLRLCVAGDYPNRAGKLMLGKLEDIRIASKGIRTAYGYTHTDAKRNASSVLRVGHCINFSTESPQDALEALALGVSVVCLLPENLPLPDKRFRECLHYTEGKTCFQCRQCAIQSRGWVIVFRPHGVARRQAQQACLDRIDVRNR